WLKSLVDSRVSRAPRVYLSFEIARNGKISNLGVQQSSGIPSLDRSAQRAVLASDPLPALPPDYRGSNVNVNFYFDFSLRTDLFYYFFFLSLLLLLDLC